MHPAIKELYHWVLTGHFSLDRGKKCTLDDIFFMNKHGSMWIGTDNATGKMIQSKGTYKTMREALFESPTNWSPLK